MKGTYILIIKNGKDQKIPIGRLGEIDFLKNAYVYVGSAMNGIEQRIRRHLRDDKKTHWHVDYLLKNTQVIEAFYKQNNIKQECEISGEFAKNLESIQNFGCSDCKCNSHLFFGEYDKIINIINKLKMKKYIEKQKS